MTFRMPIFTFTYKNKILKLVANLPLIPFRGYSKIVFLYIKTDLHASYLMSCEFTDQLKKFFPISHHAKMNKLKKKCVLNPSDIVTTHPT